VAPRRTLARGGSPAQETETVDTKAAEPDEVAAMRGMTPEERRILLRLMHEAEPEAARGAPEGGRLGLVSQGDRRRLAHHPS
jgi:hypothetical protein